MGAYFNGYLYVVSCTLLYVLINCRLLCYQILSSDVKLLSYRFCKRSLLHESLDYSLIDKIPGRQTDRKTLLGELNWIFTAVTDTIAWNVLPHGIAYMYFLTAFVSPRFTVFIFILVIHVADILAFDCRSLSEIVQTRSVSCQSVPEFFAC